MDLIDRVSLYQKEDEQVQTLMVKKYKYIINDNYISGAWEKSLKEEEKEVVCGMMFRFPRELNRTRRRSNGQ